MPDDKIFSNYEQTRQSMRPTFYGSQCMIVSGHYLASQAGMRILDHGGNAIDAGIAAGICLGVLQSDMVNFAGGDASVLQSPLHDTIGACTFGVWNGGMIGVRVGCIAEHLGIDARPPGQGMLQVLKDEDGAALGGDKAISPAGEGATGARGVARPRGHGAHRGEALAARRPGARGRAAWRIRNDDCLLMPCPIKGVMP